MQIELSSSDGSLASVCRSPENRDPPTPPSSSPRVERSGPAGKRPRYPRQSGKHHPEEATKTRAPPAGTLPGPRSPAGANCHQRPDRTNVAGNRSLLKGARDLLRVNTIANKQLPANTSLVSRSVQHSSYLRNGTLQCFATMILCLIKVLWDLLLTIFGLKDRMKREVGNTKIHEKSSEFQSEEVSRMVQESSSSISSSSTRVVQSSSSSVSSSVSTQRVSSTSIGIESSSQIGSKFKIQSCDIVINCMYK
ncbi:hypothetical protein C0J52_04966 [Blattella germanica]|nr:hypothetical protein C0J52_04966 [Blattella germanica]